MSAPTSQTDPFGRESSGSTAFRMTTYDIVKKAFAVNKIGIEGEVFSSERYVNGKQTLNIMTANWQNQGIHLFTYQEATLFLEPGKNTYTLEQVHATNYYTKTQLSADALTGATTVTIDSTELELGQEQTDDIDEDWFIGFLLADKSIFWTTVDSVVVNDVTIDDALPEDLTEGCYVVFYRDKIRSVQRLLTGGVRRISNFFSAGIGNETPIEDTSHKDFMNLPNKGSMGTTSQTYYQRELPQGTLWVWQTPQNSTEPLNFTYERMSEDFVSADDCADWPKTFYMALVYNLADLLGIDYRVPAQLKMEIKEIGLAALDDALGFDDENADFSIGLNREV